MNLRHPTMTVLASAAVEAWGLLKNSVRALLADHGHVYRPEAHYMRGPGPKWREKHPHGGITTAR